MRYLLLFLTTLSFSFALEPIVVDNTFSHTVSLHQQRIIEDRDKLLSVEDIVHYTGQDSDKATTPATKHVHWITFKIHNNSSQTQQILLKHPRAGLDFIDLYLFKESELIKKSELGDLRPHTNRLIVHRNSVELLTLSPDTTYTIVSRLQSYGPYELWWSLESISYFSSSASLKTIAWGFFGGILLALTIYNLILYFSFKQIAYLIYCCYAISLLLFHYTYQGIFYHYFSSLNLELLTISGWFWPYMTLFFSFLFPYYFFKLEKGWMGKVLLVFSGLSLFCAMYYLFAFFNMERIYVTRYILPISLLAMLYLIIFSIIILAQKRPGSIYFSIARILFTICALYDTLIIGGYMKESSFSWLVLPIGVSVELLFLSLALNEKVKLLQQQHHTNEELLIAQSRFIAIGQAIGNITHQLKTPIVQLASQFMYLQATFIHKKELFTNEFEKKIPQILNSMEYIQQSINLFSNFYKHSNQKTHFNPLVEIETIQKMLETKLILNTIDFRVYSEIESLYTHKNALMNVIIILVENAMEALIEKKPDERIIEIYFHKENYSSIKITLQDNAGNLDKQAFNKIFIEHFSTKKENCGLGLSIVKTLVEKKLEGDIKATNTPKGLLFEIHIPSV